MEIRMKKRFLAALVFLLPFYSQAQEAPYISILLGASRLNETEQFSSDTEVSFGLRLGILFGDHFSAGIYAQSFSASPNRYYHYYYGSKKFTFTNRMIDFNFYDKADEGGFWFGCLFGITQVQDDPLFRSNRSRNINQTSFGFSSGYHIMVTTNFSIAPQITYIRVDPGKLYQSFTQLSGLINFTYWARLPK